MRLGFFFVATKCLCSSAAHFVKACGASATMQDRAAEPERLKRPTAALLKRIVSEKQQRRSGQQSTDKQHCPFSCSKRQQSAIVHHVADHCQYPSPKNCEILPENLPQRIDVPHHSERTREKLSPASHTDFKKERQSERSH
jgi:hypothetical protein